MNKMISSAPRDFGRIAQQLLDEPLAILPHKAEVVACALQQKLGIISLKTIDGITLDAKDMVDRAALAADATRSYDSGRLFHADGPIAVIPVDGTLVHKFGWLDPISGMTGYDGLSRKLASAMDDSDIYGIWLDIDSPGGQVSGLFAFIQALANATQSEGGKPIYAYVNECACSAAYAIASVCDKVYGPEDAMVGSIGSVALHYDITQMLDDDGVKITVMRSGERKMRGNAYEELDEEFAIKMQESLDNVRDRFADWVSAARDISVDEALATEADWFEGQAAVDLGLMDAVVSEPEAWGRLEEEIARIRRQEGAGL